MTDTYRGGYKKALLDIEEVLDSGMFGYCKTRNQYNKMLKSLINMLLTDPKALETFMSYVEHCTFMIGDGVLKEIR